MKLRHVLTAPVCNETDIEVDSLRMDRVGAHRKQQQRAAFHYDLKSDYGADKSLTIVEMTIICHYCKALKYSVEPTGLCCAGGKIKLPQLALLPDLLR